MQGGGKRNTANGDLTFSYSMTDPEEARLAEQQAVEEVVEDKSWWSKTVSAVADTVEKTIDTVGNATSSAYNYVTENPAASLSAVVDFVPVVANLKSGIEAVTGYDPLTGRRLEPWERAVSGGAILGGAAVKGDSKVAKFAKHADNVGDVAKLNNSTDKTRQYFSTEKAAKRAAYRDAGIGKHGNKHPINELLNPGSRPPYLGKNQTREAWLSDKGHKVAHDKYGHKNPFDKPH